METPIPSVIDDGEEYVSMSTDELATFVQAHRWTYAKTIPQWPHEYVVRKNIPNDDTFCRFVMTIRRYGNDEPFFTRTHRYLDLEGFKYWTMGDWLATTIIINRATISHKARPFVPNPKPFVPVVNLSVPKYSAGSS